MSTALVTKEQTALETTIISDELVDTLGANYTVRDCIRAYKKIDEVEAKAIQMIKDQSDYKRGLCILGIKNKDKNWKTIIKDELGVAHNRATVLLKYYNRKNNFEALSKLNLLKNENQKNKNTLSLADLSFPSTVNHFDTIEGITKTEKATLQKVLKKEGKEKDEIEIAIEQMNLAKKAENYTKKKLDDLWKEIVDAGIKVNKDGGFYEVRKGEFTFISNGEEHTTDTQIKTKSKKIDKIQNAFDALSEKIRVKGLELLTNPTKEEKFEELGWTEEDQDIWDGAQSIIHSVKGIDPFFKDRVHTWKSVYKEISKYVHSDQGGASDDAQIFLNEVNAVMLKLKKFKEIEPTQLKFKRIDAEYDKWRMAQTDDIKILIEDVILDMGEDD